jgi:predicted phage baseplate assembly protein
VFAVDPEAGALRFGDGLRGRRPQRDATLRASYDYGLGRAGNVARGAITTAPALPAGFKATNPVRTWGGAEGETVAEGEKQVARYLQHRDRLVTADDFRTISRRTPGVDLGRVEVLPAFNPDASAEPGDAPGAVTLLVIPRYDAVQPDAPIPDRLFLDAVCEYLDPRRLVTTEVFLRGPTYTPIWITVGIDVIAGASIPQVRDDVKKRLAAFLTPLPAPGEDDGGWPLQRSVMQLDLIAEASRVEGVRLVNGLQLAAGGGPAVPSVDLNGWLELPRLVGISVVAGDALDLEAARGSGTAPSGGPPSTVVVPVPVIPETC